MSTAPTRGTAAKELLTNRLDGKVFTPGDPEFATAGTPWNVAYSHQPEVIVAAASVDDVVEAVGYARETGLKVGVQATGHGVTASVEGGVLVLIGDLDQVTVDPDTGTASVGGGARWGPVLDVAQDAGLAPLLGSSVTVGAVGYTLGGGFGWLGRKYGLASSQVRSFTVVVADGSVVTASETSEPDLFWALLGGGSGSLGIVVEMEMGLVPVTSVYGGNLFYPVEAVDEVFGFYRSWSEGLSDDFTTGFGIFNFPPIELVPEPLRGRAFAVVRGCHCGDQSEAAGLVDQWRRWRMPEMDVFGPMSFRDVATISQDPVDPLPAISSGRWIMRLDDDVLEGMKEAVVGGEGPSPILFAETRHGGGAMTEPMSDTSYVPPEANRLLQLVGAVPAPEPRQEATRRIDALWDSLNTKVDSVYLNFTEGEERQAQARNAFDFASWSRLVGVKAAVDPDNLFSYGLDLTS